MKSTPSGDAPGPLLDAKVYIEHDPTIGYHYVPNFHRALPRPGGGEYSLVTNSIGIRSEREYQKQKPPGALRIVVLGDSFAAGQYVSNDQRFTEILERRLPQVEVMNFALEGTGTDQQLLIFETLAKDFDPDLVIIFPFLQNIRRNIADARLSYDPETMNPILLAKPRFELMPDGSLDLRNVPVTRERKPADQGGDATKTDIDRSLKHRIKVMLSGWRFVASAKKLIYGLKPWEPFPEYKSAQTTEWKLMEAILRRLHTAAGGKPVVIVPVFYASYVQYRMARNYWDRIQSLTATPGIHAIDLLPHFKKLGRDATSCFQEPHDPHYSTRGHLVVADALEIELKKLNLL